MYRLERFLWTMALGLIVVSGQSSPVLASHSDNYAPDPLFFWETTGDTHADNPEPYRLGGCCWDDSPGRRTSVVNAETQWANNTRFNPSSQNVDTNYIIIDGRVPACQPGWTTWPQDFGAEGCTYGTPRGSFYAIYDADIYFNTTATGPTWDWGSTQLGNSTTRRNFGGILTHEIGHTIYLRDLYSGDPDGSHDECGEDGAAAYPGPAVATMCGFFGDYNQSWYARSLLLDDKESANTLYPYTP
jgi:hypothetical protein